MSYGLTAVLVVLLIWSVFLQVSAVPSQVGSVVAVFPEVGRLAEPAVIWGVAAIACWQAIALIGLHLARLDRAHKFTESAHGWLRVMIGFLLAFLLLVVSAFIALVVMGYTTPGAMLGLIVGGLVALVAVGCVTYFLLSRPVASDRAHKWLRARGRS